MEIPYNQLVSKRVKFVLNKLNPDGVVIETEDVEGVVEIVAPDESALVIKERGNPMTRLIESAHIQRETLEIIPEKPRELKSRRLDPVTLANARQHLLDRHEFQLAAINGMTDEAAVNEHDLIDHGPLGHHHARVDAEQSEPALASI